jgi:hypothetical protein
MIGIGRLRRSEQHRHPKAIRASATGDRRFQSSQRRNAADKVSTSVGGLFVQHGYRRDRLCWQRRKRARARQCYCQR